MIIVSVQQMYSALSQFQLECLRLVLEKAICRRSFQDTLGRFLSKHKEEFDVIDGRSAKDFPRFVDILQAFPIVRLHSKYVTPAAVIDEAV